MKEYNLNIKPGLLVVVIDLEKPQFTEFYLFINQNKVLHRDIAKRATIRTVIEKNNCYFISIGERYEFIISPKKINSSKYFSFAGEANSTYKVSVIDSGENYVVIGWERKTKLLETATEK